MRGWVFSIGDRDDFMSKISLTKNIVFTALTIILIEIEADFFISKEWIDAKLRWNPDDYGGIKVIRVPSDSLWTPDIVLFDK